MRNAAVLAIGLVSASIAAPPALASSSDWFETQGARVRLVTAGAPDAEGRLTGILDIDLLPGWKTYWRDPGDAGVPPSVDVTASANVASAELDFPPPQRHDDGYFKWAGYDQPVALPVTFRLKSPGEPAQIEADVFLGVCETICIPVKTKLTLDPAADPDNPGDTAAVAAALAALPGPAQPEFGVTVLSNDSKTLVLDANFPGDPASAELFVAGDQDYALGAPRRTEKEGRTQFSIEILNHPAPLPAEGGLHYTLVTDAGSVSGLLPLF